MFCRYFCFIVYYVAILIWIYIKQFHIWILFLNEEKVLGMLEVSINWNRKTSAWNECAFPLYYLQKFKSFN